MKFIDQLANGLFKKSDSGDMTFHPWGPIGKAYDIKSESELEETQRFASRYIIIETIGTTVTQMAFGTLPALTVLAVYLVIYQYVVSRSHSSSVAAQKAQDAVKA